MIESTILRTTLVPVNENKSLKRTLRDIVVEGDDLVMVRFWNGSSMFWKYFERVLKIITGGEGP